MENVINDIVISVNLTKEELKLILVLLKSTWLTRPVANLIEKLKKYE